MKKSYGEIPFRVARPFSEQSLLPGGLEQGNTVFLAEFLEQAGAMVFDGSGADAQQFSYSFAGISCGYQAQYLLFARGEFDGRC